MMGGQRVTLMMGDRLRTRGKLRKNDTTCQRRVWLVSYNTGMSREDKRPLVDVVVMWP